MFTAYFQTVLGRCFGLSGPGITPGFRQFLLSAQFIGFFLIQKKKKKKKIRVKCS